MVLDLFIYLFCLDMHRWLNLMHYFAICFMLQLSVRVLVRISVPIYYSCFLEKSLIF